MAVEREGSSGEASGTTVLAGKYRLDAVLGKGGMGVVYRGLHLGTERPIAVKVLRPELMADATLAKRFVREARAAAAIQHPNVVDVLDYGVDDGVAFQVLELLEGESLGELLSRKGKLSLEVTLSVLLPVMHALSMAHERGVVHRDLKPDNVFLARNAHGRVVPKLLDFGIAKLMKRSKDARATLATRVGSAIGTPAYMSPEQASATGDVGTATDVWAIGTLLFECLAGRLPFEAETGSILMARIITEQAPSLGSIAQDVPAPLVRVVDRALAAKQADRWPSMAEFALALRQAASLSGVEVEPPGASDTAPMSLPPPREPEIEREPRPESSDGDDDDALVTRERLTTTAARATQLRAEPEALEPRPSRRPTQLGKVRPGGGARAARGAETTGDAAASEGAAREPQSAQESLPPAMPSSARIGAAALLALVVVVVALWVGSGAWTGRSEPMVAPAAESPAGLDTAPTSDVAREPESPAPAPQPEPVIAAELPPAAPLEAPTLVAPEVPAPSDPPTTRARRPRPARTGRAEPDEASAGGDRLPQLTEW